jgi:superfamily I DNA/RNA helicase
MILEQKRVSKISVLIDLVARTDAIDQDEDPGDDGPAVTVISAHKAKGLVWDTVFVPRVTPAHG